MQVWSDAVFRKDGCLAGFSEGIGDLRKMTLRVGVHGSEAEAVETGRTPSDEG
jgi:hypothetical protein